MHSLCKKGFTVLVKSMKVLKFSFENSRPLKAEELNLELQSLKSQLPKSTRQFKIIGMPLDNDNA